MSKAHDQHLLVSDMPEQLSKNVIDAEIRENIAPVYFFFLRWIRSFPVAQLFKQWTGNLASEKKSEKPTYIGSGFC